MNCVVQRSGLGCTRLTFPLFAGVLLLAGVTSAQTNPRAGDSDSPSSNRTADPARPWVRDTVGQDQSTASRSATGRLEGEAELRWIIDRLALSETQRKDAEALVETYRYRTGEGADVTHLNALLRDYQRAEESGDQQQLETIKHELAQARPDVRARREFLVSLRQIIEPDQHPQLDAIESFLREFPSGRVSLLYLFKLARAMGLSAEQMRQLDQTHTDFRTRRIPSLGAPEEVPMSGIEEQFAREIRKILTSDQRQAFDREYAAVSSRIHSGLSRTPPTTPQASSQPQTPPTP
jgi:hypothetical protein